MKKFKSILIIAILLSSLFVFTGCSAQTKILGRWDIVKVTSGNLIMDSEELKSLGMSSAGSIRFNKSGSCKIDFLGDEYEGTWEMGNEGVVTFKYDNDKVGTVTINEKNIVVTDSLGTVYEAVKSWKTSQK